MNSRMKRLYIEMLSKKSKQLWIRWHANLCEVRYIKKQMVMNTKVKLIYVEMLSKNPIYFMNKKNKKNWIEWYSNRCGIKWVGN